MWAGRVADKTMWRISDIASYSNYAHRLCSELSPCGIKKIFLLLLIYSNDIID